jgi:hypothetical protein
MLGEQVVRPARPGQATRCFIFRGNYIVAPREMIPPVVAQGPGELELFDFLFSFQVTGPDKYLAIDIHPPNRSTLVCSRMSTWLPHLCLRVWGGIGYRP